MFNFKNKFVCLIFTVFIVSLIIPFYSFASSETSFVWSGASSPTVETVASLTEGKR